MGFNSGFKGSTDKSPEMMCRVFWYTELDSVLKTKQHSYATQGSTKFLPIVITYCCQLMNTSLTLVVLAQRNVRHLGVYEQYTTYSSQTHWGGGCAVVSCACESILLCPVVFSQFKPVHINLLSARLHNEHVTDDDQ